MRRSWFFSLLLVAALALPARAQSTRAQPPPGSAPLDSSPAIPANGIDQAPRRGFFAEAAFGVFTTVGGAAGLSNGQPYLSMAFGRNLGDNAALFLSLGIGSSSANCYDANATGVCLAADSFAATYLELGFTYGGELVSRLHLSGKIVAGGTQLAPSPVHDSNTNSVPDSLYGPHAGLGVSVDYDTHLDHFGVGIDLTGRYTFASRPDTGTFGLFSLAFMPRVRYVF